MQQQITTLLHHISHSQEQLANVLAAKTDVTVHMAGMVTNMPDLHGDSAEWESIAQFSADVTASVIAYLNSIAGLEEALTDTLRAVMKEMQPEDEE